MPEGTAGIDPVGVVVTCGCTISMQTSAMVTIHAPDLPTDAEWLNVERPLTRDDLRGRVLVLDFFTYA